MVVVIVREEHDVDLGELVEVDGRRHETTGTDPARR
jgi:hypothetical protein